ncbi:helix-turn-helix domain-containing protein [Pseudomonas sp. MT3]|uniref:helix-turn-helix domain-containing protein n=1 Tax=Pseudomonas sp. ATCC 13867 TaxID=1294143 RepID=UPI000686E1DB|nr:helix-turn-helix transcriptional regulator [Pseudomonas sp. ATCC 13867]RFQ34955.1 XRE family transcriptional regulator [Pseudomonas sp. ATCC 13867]
MVKKRFLFTAGERLRALRALTGLSRRAFAETVGMKEKDVENIEYGNQRMRDEDFEKVCSEYQDFSRWITYEGPIDSAEVTWKVADSAQRAAVYLVKRHPQLLATSNLSLEEWQARHREVLESLSEEERRISEDDAAE